MTESDLQQLLSTSSESATNNMFDQVLEPLLPMLSLFFIVSIVLTAVIVIAFIVNSIQKHRTHKAILRIDKNLQKLVDANTNVQTQVLDEKEN